MKDLTPFDFSKSGRECFSRFFFIEIIEHLQRFTIKPVIAPTMPDYSIMVVGLNFVGIAFSYIK